MPFRTRKALVSLSLLIGVSFATLINGQTNEPRDWLIHNVNEKATLFKGLIGKVDTLELSNGLVGRTFTLPATPNPSPVPPATERCPAVCGKFCCANSNCILCCANPGNRMVHGPDPGEIYPYYGKPCIQQSDCGQCTLDKTCVCTRTNSVSNTSCCVPKQTAGVGFATIALSRQGYAGREHDTSAQMLRASAPEAIVTLDNITYNVGGLVGQTDYAFLNTSLLPRMRGDPDAFYYTGHTTGAPSARYSWTPGMRHSDPTLAWPPKGITLSVNFSAPHSAPPAHRDVTITVVYALYDGVPVFEKHVIVSSSGANVMVNKLTTDIHYVTNEAMGYWGHSIAGSLTSSSISGRIHMESEMSRGGSTTNMNGDSRCTTCTQGASGDLILTSSYPLGPGAQIGSAGFHGTRFESFHTYVLVHDSDDSERQGLAIRKMYRTLAPQITENPVFMHLTDTTPAGIRSAVDQCAAVGFEMIIMSFGSGLNMESKDPKYIREVADSVAYAHSKNISIGGYNLMSSSRTVAPGGNCLGPDGKPDGAACLASSWSDDYFATIKHFITETNFDMIETDGPYEGAKCSSTTHTYHMGEADSVWTQYERNMQFYAWARERGMYIHAPDPFYMRGINKDGMGYVETNWNLPLWEQINLARQNVYDGTWTKIPSQGWMFVPIVQYHGGWPECCIEPVGFLAGQWEYYLALYFGSGVSPCYRGARIYDAKIPASKALVSKYTDWNNQYRVILHADIIHLKRPDGHGIDAILHVEPDTSKCKERAMLVVFNQNPGVTTNTTLRIPLYYSGLVTTTDVSHEGAAPVSMTLSRDWSVNLNIVMGPTSFTWYVFS